MERLRRPFEQILEYVREPVSDTPATIVLICITTFVYLCQCLSQLLLGNDVLLTIGAKKVNHLVSGEVWRLFTPHFLHINLLHLIINIVVLYAIGSTVEKFFRSSIILFIFLLSGIGFITASIAFCPRECVGASGAIMGLLGGLIAFLAHNKKVFGRGVMLRSSLLIVVAFLSLGFGQADVVDPWRHLGGLIVGLSLGWFYGPFLRSYISKPGEIKLIDTQPFPAVRTGLLVTSVTILTTGIALFMIPF